MFDKNKLTGADISIDFCGYHLQSPYILSSGPLCYGAEGMIKGHKAGAGAVVTKTIRLGAAINPVHHMGTVNNDSLINCEKWADSDRLNWYEKEIPETVAAGAIVIGSVGHTLKEAKAIVKDVEKAGAHMIELVSYTEDTLLPMLDYTKENVRGEYASLDNFIRQWSAQNKKAAIRDLLRERGIDLEAMKAEQNMADVDDFDFICHVAFDKKPLTRKERANNVRKRDFFSKYSGAAREVLEALLDKYMNTGIYEIEKTEILKLDPFIRLGKPAKIASYFGGKQGYLKAVEELEQAIYTDEVV